MCCTRVCCTTGPTTRSIAYSHLLVEGDGYAAIDRMCFGAQNLAWFQGLLFNVPHVRRMLYGKMRDMMVKSPEFMTGQRQKLSAALEKIEVMLDQPEFALPSDTHTAPGPTATGIAVASLVYPVLFPPELNVVVFGSAADTVALDTMPESLQEEVKEWRKTKVGQWALAYYAAYRLDSLAKATQPTHPSAL